MKFGFRQYSTETGRCGDFVIEDGTRMTRIRAERTGFFLIDPCVSAESASYLFPASGCGDI